MPVKLYFSYNKYPQNITFKKNIKARFKEKNYLYQITAPQ